MELVTSVQEIQENLIRFNSYKTNERQKYREYFSERLRLGKIFVVGKINEEYFFCPSRFVGYSNCTIEKHSAFPHKNGSVTTPRITQILGQPVESSEIEDAYIRLCNEIDAVPSGKDRTYWEVDLTQSTISLQPEGGTAGFPDEVSEYLEGASRRVFVNAYERNEKARAACLAHYGLNCVVCNFKFEQVYGSVGTGFMHVHHLLPISARREQYIVDPIQDLRPVCPNCHAMLHRSDPPFSVEELKELIASAKDA